MRFSKLFAPTTKETPKDCVLKSHSILIRGGFIKQIGSGIYSFLPLGKIMLSKVQKIIKEEMDKSGANEVQLGFVTPADLWEKSKRFDKYGKELLVFRDRKDNRFVLGPTHEEAIVDCAKDLVKSYKQLPLNLYQIHIKFRDEIRPRFGLMRAREFVMKDGYSFHADNADLDREFALMEATYRRIFTRLGLDFRVVEADSGAIGGSGSKEFMVLADSGEDDIVVCEKCDYAANIEAAIRAPKVAPNPAPQAEFAKFYTPNIKTIPALAEFLKIDSFWTIKCVAKKARFVVDSACEKSESAPCFFFIRGCDELNLTKALNAVPNALELVDLSTDELEKLGLFSGFIGAYSLQNITKSPYIYFDNELKDSANLACGANEKDYHFVGVDLGTFSDLKYADLIEVKSGDSCAKCGANLTIKKGIEIGHIFKLGTRYSEPLEATFLDSNGKAKPFIMGCYGIGVSRIIPAILEQKADAKGAIWGNIAPFALVIIISNTKNQNEVAFAESLYNALLAQNCEVLLDDRDERFGVKMADFELIGVRFALIVGKELQNGKIELINRANLSREAVDSNACVSDIIARIQNANQRL